MDEYVLIIDGVEVRRDESPSRLLGLADEALVEAGGYLDEINIKRVRGN